MDLFYASYVHGFAVFLPLLAIAIGSTGAARAGLKPVQISLFIVIAGALFAMWYAASDALSRTGAFNVPATFGEPPVVLMFLLGGAVGVWALAWLTPLGRRLTQATPLAAIAAFQIPRVMGGVFVIGWLAGDIPALFAIPAGLGDILAGITGWQAANALARGAPNARRLLARANVIGIADFIAAVVLGIITSEGFAHLYSLERPNIINDYPLALFPAFFVPMFLAFHLIAMSRARAAD